METVDVAIIGGGFSGVAAAIALAEQGRSIRVYEASDGAPPRFAGEFLQPAGVEVLDRMHVLPAFLERGGLPGLGFSVWSLSGDARALLLYREVPAIGHSGLYLEHGRMVQALRTRAAEAEGVTLEYNCPVEGLLQDSGSGPVVGLRLRDGREVRARLTVIADGRFSRFRSALRIPTRITLHSRTAVLLAPDAEVPDPGAGHVFLGAFGPILAYPLSGRRVRFCFDLPPDAPDDLDLVRARIRAEYAPHVPGPLRDALHRVLEDREPFPVLPTHSVWTGRCAGPGFVLIGDTAGCSHPLTAAGLTMALQDVRILQEELAPLNGASDRQAWSSALRRYEVRRYRFSDARECLTSALYEVFRESDEAHRLLREGLFRYWRSGPDARAASLALLAGVDSRVGSFLKEFASVAAYSAANAMSHRDGERTRTIRGLAGLFRVTAAQVVRGGLPLILPRRFQRVVG